MKIFPLDGLDSTLSEDLPAKFEEIAQSYKFKKVIPGFKVENDKSKQTSSFYITDVEELCSHNAGVAQSLNLHDVSLTWCQLKDIARELKISN